MEVINFFLKNNEVGFRTEGQVLPKNSTPIFSYLVKEKALICTGDNCHLAEVLDILCEIIKEFYYLQINTNHQSKLGLEKIKLMGLQTQEMLHNVEPGLQ